MTARKMLDMELHEQQWIVGGVISVLRVPGGWIYTLCITQVVGSTVTTVFVPLDNEFLEKE